MFKNIFEYLKAFYFKFVRDECSLLAGTVSYFAFFSIFPTVMLLVGIFGYVVGYEKAAGAVSSYIHSFVPRGVTLIDENLRGIVANSQTLGLIGLLGLLWAGSGIFGVLEVGLNRILLIEENRSFVNQKLMSFSMVFLGGLLILFSIFFRTVASTIAIIPHSLNYYGFLKGYAWLISLSLSILFFGSIYYIVPNASVRISEIWKGTIFAGLTFEILKYGFIWYLSSGYANFQKLYGSVGAVIVSLLWINISATILLIGAEMNADSKKRAGER